MDRNDLIEAMRECLAQIEADKTLPLEVRRVRLEPGDTLILKTGQPLPVALIEGLRATLTGAFPGHKVLVLDVGMDLEVQSMAPQS
jgi:hypothetical protein